MIKKIYKIKGMDCASCATLIEMDLEDVGVKCKCSYPRQTLEVELKDGLEEKKITEVVEKAGCNLEPLNL